MSSAHRLAPDRPRRRLPASIGVVCLACAVWTGGCAASGALRRADLAEHRQDYDLAVVEYTKAVKLRPDDTGARLALDRAKIRASQEHFNRARRLAATSKLDQALVEYELAGELNPSNG